jgi:hypothetical protein
MLLKYPPEWFGKIKNRLLNDQLYWPHEKFEWFKSKELLFQIRIPIETIQVVLKNRLQNSSRVLSCESRAVEAVGYIQFFKASLSMTAMSTLGCAFSKKPKPNETR